jgi:hypothetical protein
MAFNDNLKINGNNYSRTQTIIELSVGISQPVPITEYVKGIAYTESQDKQFDYTLGSNNRASHFGAGNITAEGTLTLTDAGLKTLVGIASANTGVANILSLGQLGGVSITIEYTTNNGVVKTDILQEVHFTSYSNGVNTDDVLYSRELPMIIGRVSNGL